MIEEELAILAVQMTFVAHQRQNQLILAFLISEVQPEIPWAHHFFFLQAFWPRWRLLAFFAHLPPVYFNLTPIRTTPIPSFLPAAAPERAKLPAQFLPFPFLIAFSQSLPALKKFLLFFSPSMTFCLASVTCLACPLLSKLLTLDPYSSLSSTF